MHLLQPLQSTHSSGDFQSFFLTRPVKLAYLGRPNGLAPKDLRERRIQMIGCANGLLLLRIVFGPLKKPCPQHVPIRVDLIWRSD